MFLYKMLSTCKYLSNYKVVRESSLLRCLLRPRRSVYKGCRFPSDPRAIPQGFWFNLRSTNSRERSCADRPIGLLSRSRVLASPHGEMHNTKSLRYDAVRCNITSSKGCGRLQATLVFRTYVGRAPGQSAAARGMHESRHDTSQQPKRRRAATHLTSCYNTTRVVPYYARTTKGDWSLASCIPCVCPRQINITKIKVKKKNNLREVESDRGGQVERCI